MNFKSVAKFAGHTSWIYGISITPDNKKLITTSFDKILIWDLKNKKLSSIIEGHSDLITSLCISTDGKFIVSGSLDKTTKVWNLDTEELIYNLAIRKDPIHSVAFSPANNIFASGGNNKYKSVKGKTTSIYLWDLENGELIDTLLGHNLRINHLVFSNDGKSLVSASNDCTAKLWNIHDKSEVKTFSKSPILDVKLTPDGKKLVSSGKDGIKIWDIQTQKQELTIDRNNDGNGCLSISPDGRLLAYGGHDCINIFDIEKFQIITKLEYDFPVTIDFSKDGAFLIAGDASCFSGEGIACVWKLENYYIKNDKRKLKLISDELDNFNYWNPLNFEDSRKRTLTSIVQRQGQNKFRQELIRACQGKCCITNCDIESTLDAAHITSYKGTHTNHVNNGLLLRADIHNLFDLHNISIDPDTMRVVIAPNLHNSHYSDLKNKKVNHSHQPNKDALKNHYDEFTRKHFTDK